jgi:hypothetical protein
MTISTTAANIRSRPAIAFGGTSSLVVWSDEQQNRPFFAIYGARISRNGRVLDRVAIPISTSPTAYKGSPVVAFDGRNYLVVWGEYTPTTATALYGARVTLGGTVLDRSPIRIAGVPFVNTSFDAAISFDGANYMIVWWQRAEPDEAIFAARVSPTGTVLDPDGLLIRRAAYYTRSPKIGFNGANYLVTWIRSSSDGNHLEGTRVNPAGSVLDPGGLQIADDLSLSDSAVGSDGTDYLVAWAYPGFSGSILGRRVTADGNVLDNDRIPIGVHGRDAKTPSIGYDGTNYFVVWTDDRSSTTEIYGARVTSAGRVLDHDGIRLSTSLPPAPRCIVPRLVGMRLSLARRRIQRAHCSLGNVRRKASPEAGIVLAQSPRSGASRRSAFPVSLVVGQR